MTTCSRASAESCTCGWRARSSSGAVADRWTRLERAHGGRPLRGRGDQPAALRSTTPAAPPRRSTPTARRRIWPSGRSSCGRESDAAEVAGVDHVDLVDLAARPTGSPATAAARRGAASEALRELDGRATRPLRASIGSAAACGRSIAARRRVERPSGRWRCCPRRSRASERAAAPRLAGPHTVPPRALPRCRQRRRGGAGGGRCGAGDRFAETEVLNTLGMAYVVARARSTRGSDLRGAIALAREGDDFDSLATAYGEPRRHARPRRAHRGGARDRARRPSPALPRHVRSYATG